ncbi:MAG: DNA primase [Candidatus Coatesbacteria bacterium]|nr:MAG: DNA primase [Candidatus Coatesbacteria bacterium]
MAEGTRNSDVERVREAVDIVAVVNRYVALREAGGQMVGLCPFHEDTKPSFSVSPAKQLFYCFGCGAGGNVFTFLTQIEGLTFGETLRKLAAEAGIELSGRRRDKAETEIASLKKAVAFAADFYRSFLKADDEYAAAARKYLADRGVTNESIEHFGMGLAPNSWDALLGRASRAGLNPDVMEAAGVVKRRKDGSGRYDRFRARIVFPIYNVMGEPVGFGGRAFGAEKEETPKYINSPNTAIYDKSRTIYNLDRARAAIAKAERILVVEGYFDVLGVHQVGVENTVAASGTSLNDTMARTLVRFAREVVMFFDGDTAGQAATARAMSHLLEQGARVRVVVLPTDEDPFDIAVSRGRESIDELINSSIDWLDFVFAGVREKHRGDDVGSKLAVIREVEGLVSKIPSRVERAFWMDRFAKVLGIDPGMIDMKRGAPQLPEDKRDHAACLDPETSLLRVLLRYPGMVEDYSHRLERVTFYDERVLRVVFLLREYAGRDDIIHRVLEGLEPEDQRFVTELVMIERPGEDVGRIASDCLRELDRRRQDRQLGDILERLSDGEADEVTAQEALDFVEEKRRFLGLDDTGGGVSS